MHSYGLPTRICDYCNLPKTFEQIFIATISKFLRVIKISTISNVADLYSYHEGQETKEREDIETEISPAVDRLNMQGIFTNSWLSKLRVMWFI